MLLGFGYLCGCYVLFLFLLKKQEIIDLKKKASWPKFCDIVFLFFFKVGSVRPADQQINFVLP